MFYPCCGIVLVSDCVAVTAVVVDVSFDEEDEEDNKTIFGVTLFIATVEVDPSVEIEYFSW